MKRHLVASLAVLLGSLSTAHAQSEEEGRAVDVNRERAAQRLDIGNRHFEAKQYESALEEYRKAYDLFASPKILFNIAEALRESKRSVDAANTYASFLGSDSIDPKSEAAVLAQRHLDALDAGLARIRIEGDLESATITCDGKPIDRSDEGTLRVEGGAHEIRAENPSGTPFLARIDAPVGTTMTVRIEFDTIATPAIPDAVEKPVAEPAPPIAAPQIAREEVHRDDGPDWWIWAAVGTVFAIAVAGVAVAATSGGDDIIPMGELPETSTADWMRR